MNSLACVAVRRAHSAAAPRVPMIKFIGKRSLLPKTAHHAASTPAAAPAATAVASIPTPAARPAAPQPTKKVGNGIDMIALKDGAWHGRPKLSKAEMEAIDMGGAGLIY